jgi:hypothetical protein
MLPYVFLAGTILRSVNTSPLRPAKAQVVLRIDQAYFSVIAFVFQNTLLLLDTSFLVLNLLT